MNAPTVSIVLPTFNRLKYLRPAVDSVFAQSFADWELLIADDGSDGETRSFLTDLADLPRVKVLWLPHTGRPSTARNAALRAAQGEYLAFLDSDDLWLPSKLEVQIRSLQCHNSRHWAYAGFTIVDGSGSPRPGRNDRRWPCPEGWIFEPLLKMQATIVTSTVVASRSLVEQLGGFDEGLRVCEDYDLWLRLALRSGVDVVEEPVVHVRRHTEHYADDLSALEDWKRVLEQTRGRGLDRHLDSISQGELAKVASLIARRHAISGDRGGVLQTLMRSWRYSWPYRHWWLGAIAAIARLFVPPRMHRAVRECRRRANALTGVRS